MTTSIEWTDTVWNPTVGCSRVSAGCELCYAERVAHRGMSPQHRGLTVLGKAGIRWTGEVRFLPDRLAEPLRWRKPRRVFVNSMSDLFHEKLTNDQIAAVFGVMAACPTHTFQVLTKRPERMREWFTWAGSVESAHAACTHLAMLRCEWRPRGLHSFEWMAPLDGPWPLPNVWLGVSVENQATADERIPLLLDTPAAIRWVSYEPALGPVDFTALDILGQTKSEPHPYDPIVRLNALTGLCAGPDEYHPNHLDWIVVGGESGGGARPFALEWAERTVRQCRNAAVPVFVKQLGAHVVSEQRRDLDGSWAWRMGLTDAKGGDMSQWPEDLRVREFPEVRGG